MDDCLLEEMAEAKARGRTWRPTWRVWSAAAGTTTWAAARSPGARVCDQGLQPGCAVL